MDSGRPKIVIHLVHGTWGRGVLQTKRTASKRWFEPGSDFRQAVRERVFSHDLVFRPLLWSGRNSIIDRNEAAKRLAKRIDRTALADPSTKQVVIAHSHGGNAALRAMCLRETSHPTVGMVTMATPFLKVFEISRFAPQLKMYRSIATALTLSIFIFSMPTIFPAYVNYIDRTLPFIASNRLLTTIAIMAMIFAFVISILKITYLLFDLAFGMKYIEKSARNRAAELVSISSFPVDAQKPTRMLVLRGPGDEATLALVTGYVTTWISSVLARLLSSIGSKAYYAGITIFGLATLVSDFRPEVGEYLDWLISLLSAAALPLLAIFVLLPALLAVLAALGKGTAGTELLFGSAPFDVGIDSTPDGVQNMDVLTILEDQSSSDTKVRHFIHEQKLCRWAAASWIDAFVDGSKWDGERWDGKQCGLQLQDERYLQADADGKILLADDSHKPGRGWLYSLGNSLRPAIGRRRRARGDGTDP